eukprot:TRINITY_DN31743_c0_g1_i1.p1 TRINITY_DN31743_c0_g1~~TRINITY_DN31743_c0_g1_i1.p1  ORF type:complete len:512 (+),score=147.34 TRINITY_DN31743_c0_g1_i1:72-1538(+)
MANAILSTVQKEFGNQSRDFSGLVRQVKDILPQYSDDIVCDALIQSDEDVMRAVDLLLNSTFTTKAGKKREKKLAAEAAKQSEAGSQQARGSGDWANEEEAVQEAAAPAAPPREERPKTENEKAVARLRKKMREIKTIEEKLARGEKVDPLQLPKLEKKSDLEYDILVLERKIRQEEAQMLEEQKALEEEQKKQAAEERRRQEEELRQAQEEERRRRQQEEAAHLARERATAERAERAEVQRARDLQFQREQEAQHQPLQQEWQQSPPQPQGLGLGDMSSQLLGMLHKNPAPESDSYEQSRRMADELSGGRVGKGGGKGKKSGGYNRQHDDWNGGYQQQRYQNWNSKGGRGDWNSKGDWHSNGNWHSQKNDNWSAEERKAPDREAHRQEGGKGKKDSLIDDYSTPLDISRIPAEKRAEAERIAKEIEHGSGGYDNSNRGRSNGGGKGDYRKGGGKSKGKSKGKSNDSSYPENPPGIDTNEMPGRMKWS